MKLFIDSGNIKDIETLAALGIIDGVTTNPSLLAKEPGDYRENLKKICDIVNGPVSGEVVATDFAGMMREGHDIAKHRPAHGRQSAAHARRHQGLQDALRRRHQGQRHARLLGGAGAARGEGRRDFRQPVRRPAGRCRRPNGMELIREIVEIYDNYEFTTEVLVASCRHPIHIVEAARMGADICTCPPAVIDQLFNHPLTNIGLEKFLKDWEKAQAVVRRSARIELPR